VRDDSHGRVTRSVSRNAVQTRIFLGMRSSARLHAAALCAVLLTGRAAIAQPPATTGPSVTAADVRFMQEMIGHHAQALEMTAIITTHTRRADLRTLGERITISQRDEIALMTRWLEAHSAAVPATSGDAMPMAGMSGPHDMALMPGMLTPAQMTALRAARGPRFDRLFLTGMIQHHGGALAMVRALLATTGAAQESSINRFVSDVDTDQRAEIARMQRLLFSK
jgi:uncharacterized protein (DUF305 family)